MGGSARGLTLTDLLAPRPSDESTVAVHAGERQLTRADLRTSVMALAERLRGAGLQPGQGVAVWSPNTLETVAAMFAVWWAGGVHIPVNPRLADSEVRHIVETVRPTIRLDGDTIEHLGDGQAFDRDIALVQWTSGTTGRPRPVLLKHSGFLALLEPVVRKLTGASSEQLAQRAAPMPNLIPTSLALSAGIYNVLFAFRVGAPVVLMEQFSTGEFAELVARHGLRSTVLPPAAMTMLADDESITSLAPLRYVRSISAPLSPRQARRFRDRFGVVVLNCYGQTEIGGEIIGWNAADARAYGDEKLGSIGRPHDGVSVRIVDGELWVRTPALTAGYADGGDIADRMTPDGWLRTGDIARVDEDGFVWVEGRVSDVINRGGLKVFPAEVEEVLRASPEVADCAVVTASDDRLGEVPWAFVVPAGSAELDTDQLVEHCRASLAPYKIPVRFVAVADLPRNEAGKVLVRELLAQAR